MVTSPPDDENPDSSNLPENKLPDDLKKAEEINKQVQDRKKIEEAIKYLSADTLDVLRQFVVLASKDPYIARRIVMGDKESVVELRRAKRESSYKGSAYYKEHYAIELRDNIVKAMLKDGKDRVFSQSNFPKTSLESMSQKVRQSLNYLCDKMDEPDLVYTKFKEHTYITIEQKKGRVRLGFDKNKNEGMLKADVLEENEPEELANEWLPVITDFLEKEYDPEMPRLKLQGLELDEDDINLAKSFLMDIPNITYSVSRTEIKILKHLPTSDLPPV